MRHARAAFEHIASELYEIDCEGESFWLLDDPRGLLDESPVPGLHLIPAYDPYLLGYQNRDWMVDPAYARRLHPGGGLLYPTVLIDGKAAGTWRLTRAKDGQMLEVHPFTTLPDPVQSQLTAEAADIGRFLATDVRLLIDSA